MDNSTKQLLKQLKENESTISMILGGLVVVVVGVLMFNYFKNAPQPQLTEEAGQTAVDEYVLEFEEDAETGEKTPKGLPKTHKVELGESLWSISEEYYGSGYNWTDIAVENNMVDPDGLAVGQEITVPKVAAKAQTAMVAEVEAVEAGNASISGDVYKVEKGDYLWEIAVRAYGDGYKWGEIFEANKDMISDANQIEIGMELKLPR